jgi:glycosyltransferase involved in cell wall biosynthesis
VSSVDVVIPCYRYGALLPDAVRSVLDQQGVDVRVLVIDDASDDGSGEVARELAASDPRVEASVHVRNRGHIATFNEGVLDWATAEYSLLISADDELSPGALARAAALLDAHPRAGFVYGNAQRWDNGAPRPVYRTGAWEPIVHDGHAWLRGRYAAGTNPVFSPTVVVRTALQQQVGGYDARMLHTSDLEMWLKLALHGDVGYVSGVDQGLYRVHETNMSNSYYRADSGVRDLEMRLLAFSAVLERGRDVLPDAAALDQRVRRALAKEALLRVNRGYDKGHARTDPGERLVAFARHTAVDVTRLPEWHALRLRRRLGPRIAPVLQPLVLTAAARRLRQRRREERLVREGIE